MESVLRGVTHDSCLVYLDVVIFIQVFQIVRQAHMKLKLAECQVFP
jgi:hypothetical protein